MSSRVAHEPWCNVYHTPLEPCEKYQAEPEPEPEPLPSPAVPATRIEWCGNLQVHVPIKENQK